MISNTTKCERLVVLVFFALLMAALSCSDHIIQRSTSDYFQYEPGNWWELLSETDTLYVEVESPDTILQKETFPVSYSGIAHFIFEADDGLYEYISVVYTFSGSEYQVIDDFIVRVELPLVNGNMWQDSLTGSITVSNQEISARYDVKGSIIGCEYDDTYDGDVYTIEMMSSIMLETPDTTFIDSLSMVEAYAPGIGIVRFMNQDNDYELSDYLVQ